MQSPIAQIDGDGGAEVMVGVDLAALVERQPDLVEAKAVGVGPAADRDEHRVGLDRRGFAALGRLDRQRRLAALDGGAGDLGPGLDVEALLLEDLGAFLAHFLVHAGQDLVEIFDDGDLGAKPQPHAAELEPDHAAADHDHMFGHLGQRERAGRIDDHAGIIVDRRPRAAA